MFGIDTLLEKCPQCGAWSMAAGYRIVELDDGSRWQIFPGDLDLTLNWKPETDLRVVPSDDEISTHMLVDGGAKVHVIAAGESWPVKDVKSALKEG